MSKASDIAQWLNERIATITLAGGYATDIGVKVFRGRMKIDPDDMPCTVIVEGEDSPSAAKRTHTKLSQNYIFEGHDECDPNHPNDKAHLIIADLKRAIFSTPVGIGGSYMDGKISEINYRGRTIGARPDGVALVAAAIEIEIVYEENLANP